MSDSKPAETEMNHLRHLQLSLERMRLRNRRLAQDTESLITDFLSRGKAPVQDEEESGEPNNSSH